MTDPGEPRSEVEPGERQLEGPAGKTSAGGRSREKGGRRTELGERPPNGRVGRTAA